MNEVYSKYSSVVITIVQQISEETQVSCCIIMASRVKIVTSEYTATLSPNVIKKVYFVFMFLCKEWTTIYTRISLRHPRE